MDWCDDAAMEIVAAYPDLDGEGGMLAQSQQSDEAWMHFMHEKIAEIVRKHHREDALSRRCANNNN
jgi:hypothetical protein